MVSFNRHSGSSAAWSAWSVLLTSLLVVGGTIGGGCQAGVGEGEANGTFQADECGLSDGAPVAFELDPDFYTQDHWRFTSSIRAQRSSGFADQSDGLTFAITDVDEVLANLGSPIPIEPDGPVQVSVNLGQTCATGRPQGNRRGTPVNYEAVSGTVTFTSLYVPDVSNNGLVNAATFDLVFQGADDSQTATLAGFFDFVYNRGRPGQRFP